MYLYYVYGSATNPNKIYNNAVVFGSGTSYNYGIYMYHPSNLEVFNNTIRTGTAYSVQPSGLRQCVDVLKLSSPISLHQEQHFCQRRAGLPDVLLCQ